MGTSFDPNHSKTQSSLSYESDCKTIYESWGRLSTLVRTLATRMTHVERRQIRETYKEMYEEDLLTHLQMLKHKLLSTNNEESKLILVKACEALFLWLCDPWERDACLAKEALQGNVVDFKALIELFVARKSSHVVMIKQAYQARFKRQLDQDIATFEPPHPCQKGMQQLKKVYSTQFEDVLRNLVQCIQDPPKYYAKMLQRSIQGEEAMSKGTLTRLMVCRAEIDMGDIQKMFRTKFGVQFKDAILEPIPAGDYRDFILALAITNAVTPSH